MKLSMDLELGDDVVVIAKTIDENAASITLQTFIQKSQEFIPIFSSEREFLHEVQGSGFEGKGLVIKRDFLASLLRGDEILLLNPGSERPMQLQKSDLVVDPTQ